MADFNPWVPASEPADLVLVIEGHRQHLDRLLENPRPVGGLEEPGHGLPATLGPFRALRESMVNGLFPTAPVAAVLV